MKKFLIAAAALASVAMTAPATAADLPVKAPPVVMPALYNWSGLYIGVEGGAIMGQTTHLTFNSASCFPFCGTLPIIVTAVANGGPLGVDFGHPLHGGFVGGEVGFNWQMPGNRWVFGIEADGNWSELEESLTCPNPIFFCGSKIRDFETLRARIGYAFGPRGDFLVFVTGGWATASQAYFTGELFVPTQTAINILTTPPTVTIVAQSPAQSFTEWRRTDGFVVGGGAEYGITPWLSLKGEVLYVNLGRKDYAGGTISSFGCGFILFVASGQAPCLANPASIKSDFVLARMALNWRFNWGKGKAPAAVVASY